MNRLYNNELALKSIAQLLLAIEPATTPLFIAILSDSMSAVNVINGTWSFSILSKEYCTIYCSLYSLYYNNDNRQINLLNLMLC